MNKHKQMPHPMNYYKPINAYGVIGDCRSVLLIAPNGSIDWGCLPDFDSPAFFCRLLDEQQGGYFQIAPSSGTIPGSQRYLPGSNVLQTRFTGRSGAITLTDFMPIETAKAWPLREIHSAGKQQDGSFERLVRMVECSYGEMSITARLKVTPNYAASPTDVSLFPGLGAAISGADQHVAVAMIDRRVSSPTSMTLDQGPGEAHPTLVIQTTLRKGERVFFALGMADTLETARQMLETDFQQRNFEVELEQTLQSWQTWLDGSQYAGPYNELVERSALVLKLLTYAPTGAIVAAPTTSLPEEIGGTRNWDYRFTWLRDASFTLYALSVLGFTEESHAFTHWLQKISYSEGEDLQILYGIRGERELAEKVLEHLSGYKNSQPVRIGNGAARQVQLDVFGEVLDCLHQYRRQGCFELYGEKLEGPLWSLMCVMAEQVCKHWKEADSGIWEVRDGLHHFLYSKVMCWVALDRVIRAAEQEHLEADLLRWREVREQIRTDVLAHGYNPQVGAFTQSYDSTILDASSLLLPLVGFIPATDPRMRSTVDRIMEHLTDKQGFVFRYNGEDGLNGGEGTFTICSFWLVDNLAMQGRLDEARSLFEHLVSHAGYLGLFSEEIEAGSGAALGNYPQAFTHIALINSAQNLYRAEQQMAEHHPRTAPLIAAISFVKE
ncbi:MAG TPA: glycoside hydrolase family 15 protein [Ktedonobacteraceae bacterium]|nr:glycoside hydrolase family 15 protein [Ktedonobacteraceae bacterium]